MKKTLYVSAVLAGAVCFASCNKADVESPQVESNLVKLKATIDDQDTKTTLEGLNVFWSDGDAVGVYSETDKNKTVYTSDNTGTGTKYAVFTGAAKEGTKYTVLYPASSAANTYIEGIELRIPLTQTYVANTVAPGYLPMCATGTSLDDALSFHHVASIVKVKVYSSTPRTITSAKLKVNAHNRAIWKSSINLDTWVWADYGGIDINNTITLNLGEGVALGSDAEHATVFHFVIWGGTTVAGGFTVSLTTSGSETMTLSKNSSFTFIAGNVHSFPATAFVVDPADPEKRVKLDSGEWETLGECSGTPTTKVEVKTTDGHPLNSTDMDQVLTIVNRASSAVILDLRESTYVTTTFVPISTNKVSSILGFPSNVTTLPNYALRDSYALTSVNFAGITTFNQYPVDYCGLTSVTLPATLTTIGAWIAHNNSNLEAFYVEAGNTKFKAVDGVLFNYSGTKLLEYPAKKAGTSYTIPDGVTNTADIAFAQGGLTEIYMPSSMTTFRLNAYSNYYIKTIHFASDTPPTIVNASKLPNKGTMYVPTGRGTAYSTALSELVDKGWTVNDGSGS